MRKRREHVLFVFALAGDELVEAREAIGSLIQSATPFTVVTCARSHNSRDEAVALAELRELGVSDHRFLGSVGARWPEKEPREYVESRWRGADFRPGSFAPHPEGSLVDAPFGEVSGDIAAAAFDVDATTIVTHHQSVDDPDRNRVLDTALRAAEVMDIPCFSARGDTIEPLSAPTDAPATFAEQSTFTKIAMSIVFAALGAITGLLMTAIHQLSSVVGGVTLPWGILAGFAAVIALVLGARLALASRIPAAIAGVGVLAASIFVSSPTRGGSVIVTDNLAGILWTWLVPVVVLAIVLWPKSRPAQAAKIEPQPAVKGFSIP